MKKIFESFAQNFTDTDNSYFDSFSKQDTDEKITYYANWLQNNTIFRIDRIVLFKSSDENEEHKKLAIERLKKCISFEPDNSINLDLTEYVNMLIEHNWHDKYISWQIFASSIVNNKLDENIKFNKITGIHTIFPTGALLNDNYENKLYSLEGFPKDMPNTKLCLYMQHFYELKDLYTNEHKTIGTLDVTNTYIGRFTFLKTYYDFKYAKDNNGEIDWGTINTGYQEKFINWLKAELEKTNTTVVSEFIFPGEFETIHIDMKENKIITTAEDPQTRLEIIKMYH